MQNVQKLARQEIIQSIEEVEPVDTHRLLCDYLNETYPTVSIGKIQFSPARVLEELEKPAFRAMENDFISNQKDIVPCGAYHYKREDLKTSFQKLIDELESYGREFSSLTDEVKRQVGMILGK